MQSNIRRHRELVMRRPYIYTNSFLGLFSLRNIRGVGPSEGP